MSDAYKCDSCGSYFSDSVWECVKCVQKHSDKMAREQRQEEYEDAGADIMMEVSR